MTTFSSKSSDCICFPTTAATAVQILSSSSLQGEKTRRGESDARPPQQRIVGASREGKWTSSNSSAKFGDNKMSWILCTSKTCFLSLFLGISHHHMLHVSRFTNTSLRIPCGVSSWSKKNIFCEHNIVCDVFCTAISQWKAHTGAQIPSCFIPWWSEN